MSGTTEADRQRFIKAYVDLVGELGTHNRNLLWWATDISSKNRFFSSLGPMLEGIYKGEPKQESSPLFVRVLCGWARRVARILRHIIYIVPRIMKARKLFASSIAKSSADPKSVYAIKTFIASRAFDNKGNYKDLFFGSLTDYIAKSRRVIVLSDVMDDYDATIARMHQYGKDAIYPLEAFLSIGDVLKASALMLFYKINVPRKIQFLGNDVTDALCELVLSDASKIQPLHLYQYFVMKNFLKKFKVSEFLFTCEFNPWERMCLKAIEESSPTTTTIGYQHTVVPQASVNMFTSQLDESLAPKLHKILTVGQKPKVIIERYRSGSRETIQASCGLRFEYLFGAAQGERHNKGHVLLALEGLPQVVEMTDYVLKQLAGSPYKLKIRTHPVLPLEKFVNNLSSDPRLQANVTVSSGTSLKDDILWADMVVYWGTTVALEALSMGKPVVHYDNGSLLSYDPLFELEDFKWQVSATDDLVDVLDGISALSEEQYGAGRQKAQRYIAEYFHPVTQQTMAGFLGKE